METIPLPKRLRRSSPSLSVLAVALRTLFRTLFTKKALTPASGLGPLAAAAGNWGLGSGLGNARGLTAAALPDLPYDYGA
ncbi:hypothetical protein GW17_00055889, partial [Ensete ventricosum]